MTTYTYIFKFLAKMGVQTVLCNGEAGEFASLGMEERRLLVEFARESFSGELVLLILS